MKPGKPGCLLLFLAVLLIGMAPVIPVVVLMFFSGLLTGAWLVAAVALVAGSAGILAYLYFARMVVHRIWGRTSIVLNDQTLRVRQRVFGFGWGFTIDTKTIKHVGQVHMPATDDNSFEGWGVRVNSDDRLWILHQESEEATRWLAEFLADRLHVPQKQESR